MDAVGVEELPVAVLGDADLQARLLETAAAVERATAELVEVLGEWDDRRVWLHQRGAGPKEFLVLEGRQSHGQAAMLLHAARAIHRCPVTAAALADGRLSLAKARIIALFGVGHRVRTAFLACEEDIVERCLRSTWSRPPST